MNQETIAILSSSLKLQLTGAQEAKFDQYKALLIEWNKKINLTAVRSPDGIERTHFLDSLSSLLIFDSLNHDTMIDIGSGAGFPAIPLKILFPSLQLTLVESIRKKADFLQLVTEHLELTGVRVLADRAENLGQDINFRQQFDWVVARAVAGLNTLVEYSLPFCRLGGQVVAFKGPEASNELLAAQGAIERLGGKHLTTVAVPNEVSKDRERYLLVIKKVGQTPQLYPRRVGLPLKRPLQ